MAWSPVPVAAWAGPMVATFWASVTAGLALCLAWRFLPPGPARTAVQWAGSLLFFAPHVPVLLAWNVAAPLVTLQRGLMGVWLLVGGVVAALPVRRRHVTGGRAVVAGAVSVTMLAGGLALATSVARNLSSDPVAFSGVVHQTSAGYRTSAPTIEVGGARFRVTRDLAARLHTGMPVEGLALAGTRHIVQLQAATG